MRESLGWFRHRCVDEGSTPMSFFAHLTTSFRCETRGCRVGEPPAHVCGSCSPLAILVVTLAAVLPHVSGNELGDPGDLHRRSPGRGDDQHLDRSSRRSCRDCLQL